MQTLALLQRGKCWKSATTTGFVEFGSVVLETIFMQSEIFLEYGSAI